MIENKETFWIQNKRFDRYLPLLKQLQHKNKETFSFVLSFFSRDFCCSFTICYLFLLMLTRLLNTWHDNHSTIAFNWRNCRKMASVPMDLVWNHKIFMFCWFFFWNPNNFCKNSKNSAVLMKLITMKKKLKEVLRKKFLISWRKNFEIIFNLSHAN